MCLYHHLGSLLNLDLMEPIKGYLEKIKPILCNVLDVEFIELYKYLKISKIHSRFYKKFQYLL